jgi:hypothetical protein
MNQQIITSNIKTGDTLLTSGTKFLAEAIQTFEKCKWNHDAMFVWINGVLYVVEACMKGIILTRFSDYTSSNNGLLIMKPKFVMPSEGDILNFTLPYVGHTNYGFFNLIVAQAFRFLTKKKLWIGPKKDPMTHNFICGEFVGFVYNNFDQKLFDDWNKIAPSDIFESDFFDKFVFQ